MWEELSSFLLHFYFSINIVKLLLKFYDFFFFLILDNEIHFNYWYYFFDLVVLIDCANYFLTYDNIKMTKTGNLFVNFYIYCSNKTVNQAQLGWD